MTTRLLNRAAVSTAGAMLVLASGLIPAHARTPQSAPTWTVVGGWGSAGGDSQVWSVASPSSTTAFAAGSLCDMGCVTATLEVQQWHGATWSAITPPAGLTNPAAILGVLVTASSAQNAWVYPDLYQRTGSTSKFWTDALLWNGTKWTVTTFPQNSYVYTAVAFSRTNAWAFGTSGRTNAPFNSRYNGTAWKRVRLPGVPQVLSAVSASDMWAIGPTAKTATKPLLKQSDVVMHWTGSTWRTLALPAISKPAKDAVTPAAIVAFSPRDVWASFSIVTPSDSSTGLLEHWDGARWQRVRIPYPVYQVTSMAQDGQGGLWLVAQTNGNGTRAFYHLRDGSWSQQSMPAVTGGIIGSAGLSWVPGTKSLWASAIEEDTMGGNQGLILKYGS